MNILQIVMVEFQPKNDEQDGKNMEKNNNGREEERNYLLKKPLTNY